MLEHAQNTSNILCFIFDIDYSDFEPYHTCIIFGESKTSKGECKPIDPISFQQINK